MNLETRRPRGRPRNRWQDEVMEDGRMVGGEEWQGEVYDREEWKKLLRTARNCCILHMPMEQNRIVQTPYSLHNCSCQKNSKWLSKIANNQAESLSTRVLHFLIKCTSRQTVTLLTNYTIKTRAKTSNHLCNQDNYSGTDT
jgi:hypothetical protein